MKDHIFYLNVTNLLLRNTVKIRAEFVPYKMRLLGFAAVIVHWAFSLRFLAISGESPNTILTNRELLEAMANGRVG